MVDKIKDPETHKSLKTGFQNFKNESSKIAKSTYEGTKNFVSNSEYRHECIQKGKQNVMQIGKEIGTGVGKTIQFGKNLGNKEYRAELAKNMKKEGKILGDQVGKFGQSVMKAP